MAEFNALLLERGDDGATHARITTLDDGQLPAGDVLVEVHYSSLNYKDGLAVTGKGKIVRQFPFVPGIDFAGRVVESQSSDYALGDAVILTGWGVGERHWGGFSQRARVKSAWLTPLPQGMSLEQAMALGTAGFTAMLAVMALEAQGVTPSTGKVLVTGAGGGVGSVAVALLARRGYEVHAATGRAETRDYLKGLGAAELVDRAALAEKGKPLASEIWAGAIDNVGGQTLATVLSQMAYGGTVAAVGLAGGHELPTTVFPFILRGVTLVGIDSVMCPAVRRREAWGRLAEELDPALLATMTQVVPLDELPALAEAITQGQVRGRVVVDVNA